MANLQSQLAEVEAAVDQMEALDVPAGPTAPASIASAQTRVDILTRVCGVYKPVRPFLLLVTSFFFIPDKWRNSIRVFTQSMDTICTGSGI